MKPQYRRVRKRVRKNMKHINSRMKRRSDNKMNTLNKSVIICDPSPTPAKRKNAKRRSKASILRPSRLTKILTIAEKISNYESPLQHIRDRNDKIQLSSNENSLVKEDRTNRRGMDKKDLSNPVDNTIIVLSDSENETNDKKTGRYNDFDLDSYIKYTESMNELRNSLEKNGISTCMTQKKRKKRSALQDANQTCDISLISDTEEPGPSCAIRHDEENIEPSSKSLNQTSDDITVIWSSKEKPSMKEEKVPKERTSQYNLRRRKRKKSANGIIEDRSGDLNNLIVLESNNEVKKIRRSSRRISGLKVPVDTVNIRKRKRMEKKNEHKTSKQSATTEKRVVQENNNAPEGSLREIIVDGCNVAMAHSNGKFFSEMGLKLIIDYFSQRGHSVKVFLPQHKRSIRKPLLEKWYTDGIVVFTPSRKIGGKVITSYDDRFILEYATMQDGIVVSLDQYRDLYEEKPEWRDTIENRLLAPTFVGDCVMFPDDPLGRKGPTLNEFLRHKSVKTSMATSEAS